MPRVRPWKSKFSSTKSAAEGGEARTSTPTTLYEGGQVSAFPQGGRAAESGWSTLTAGRGQACGAHAPRRPSRSRGERYRRSTASGYLTGGSRLVTGRGDVSLGLSQGHDAVCGASGVGHARSARRPVWALGLNGLVVLLTVVGLIRRGQCRTWTRKPYRRRNHEVRVPT